MDHSRSLHNSAGLDQQQQQQQMSPPSSHFTDMSGWQQQRPSSASHQQQYGSYPAHQSQYQSSFPHYAHQSQLNPTSSSISAFSAGQGRYYPPTPLSHSKAPALPHIPPTSSSPHAKSSMKLGGYSSPVMQADYRNGGGSFPTTSFSDGSSSDNLNHHEEEAESSSGAAAATATNQQQPLGPSPLRRGQACQNCRRRKLKCDAERPVCGTCTRSRKAAASANHASPIVEGDCIYDDGPASSSIGQGAGRAPSASSDNKARRVSNAKGSLPQGLGFRDDSKAVKKESPSLQRTHKRRKTIDEHDWRSPPAWDSYSRRRQEESDYPLDPLPGETVHQRSQRLENRIRELESMLKERDGNGEEHAAERQDSTESERKSSYSGPAVSIISMLSPSSGKEERYRMQYSQRPARHPTGSNLKHETTHPGQDASAPLFDLNTDSIEIDRDEQIRSELAKGHCARDDPILQLLWPGWSTDLPSPDTVMTICETFFRQHPMKSLVYKPSFMSGLSLPPNHPHRPHDSLIHAMLATTADISPFFEVKRNDTQDRFVMLLSDTRSRPKPGQTQSASSGHLSFKEFHLRKAREKVEYSLITEFRNPLDWVAACLLSCFTLWSDFRVTESYFLSAILARAASPAGLDKLPSRHFSQESDTDRVPGLFGLPEGVEEQERRMTFWHLFITDEFTGGTPLFYENLISESSILTHLPCAVADFQAGRDVAPNPQTLTSPDLFRTGHIDDFTLHIKSAVLVRRACTLQCRNQLTKKKPTGLAVVDKQISEFIESFPSFDFGSLDSISVDKLTAWNNIWLAIFHLHEPYLTPTSIAVKDNDLSANYSIKRISLAVDKVLSMIHFLMNSSFDFALLHPQTYLTWSVCARMLGKEMDLLKRRAGQGGEGSLHAVTEKLHCIVMALERAGEKNVKARRCSELVSYVRSGTLNEGILSQLLYTDGVIPTGDEDTPSSMPSTMTSDTSFEALMMSTTGNDDGGHAPRKTESLLPHDFSIPANASDLTAASLLDASTLASWQ